MNAPRTATGESRLARFTQEVYYMIRKVTIRTKAEKQLLSGPRHVASKLKGWVQLVEIKGLEEAKKIPGYHDEPLRGEREGQRSIRLSRAYRAIYEIKKDGESEVVSVEEVSKHDY
jgi:proteic killer suppression protein